MAQLPDINVPWAELEDNAADMASRAGVAASYLTDAATAWERFRSFYRHQATEELVHAALDELLEPTADWRRSVTVASEIVREFAARGRVLERRRQELEHQLLELERQLLEKGSRPGAGHDAVEEDAGSMDTNSAGQQLDDRVAALNRDWTDLQETTAAALAGISYGNGAGLPLGAVSGGNVLPAVAWSTLTGRLDDRFGALNPDALLPSLVGLGEAELREWAAANPEAAALLAGRALTGPFRAGTPEALMRTAMADGADITEDGIAGIRDAWLGLSPQDQERLMLLYPAVFGSLNGVPFAQRAKANLITVPGFHDSLRKQLAALSEPQGADYSSDRQGASQWKSDHDEWSKQREQLERKLRGLEYVLKENVQVVLVGLEGDGQVVTMVGSPSANTKIMGTLVPGMDVDLGELEANSRRLAAITDDPSEDAVSFYWQGSAVAQNVLDSSTPHFNELAGPLLAAFDYAVDLEVPSDARTTYVGYSAGGALLGTGEREGLDSTNIVYVAQAGPGHNVSRPEDTANPNANRYWLQTRSDHGIEFAQVIGGSANGGSVWTGGGVGGMGVTRLETGFIDPTDAETLMGGHSQYFSSLSTSASNIRAVISGGRVSLFVPYTWYSTPDGGFYFSPIEANPEDYLGSRLETVETKDIENDGG